MSNQSFAKAENVEFQKLLIYLRPQVARDLIRRDSLKDKTMSFAEVMRNKLKDKLRVSPLFDCFKSDMLTFLQSLPGKLAITSNAWTSTNQIAFLATTCSFINTNWTLWEVLLDFREIPGAHSGENMACLVYNTLEEMGISEKVSFVPAR